MNTIHSELVKKSSRWTIAWAILLIVLGACAIASPVAASLTMGVVVGWLLIVSALVHLLSAFRADGFGSAVWTGLVGAAYLAVGSTILSHPLWGIATLTLFISMGLLIEGFLGVTAYLVVRQFAGSTWLLLNALVTIVLGLMIWNQWPSSSLWVVGTIIGLNLMMTGVTRLALAMTARRIQNVFVTA
jgi:uncharacterized membrane protein HdeD (DUF308 family)